MLFFVIIFILVFFEIFLRIAYPRYRNAAEAQFSMNQSRIFENPKNTTLSRQHPDSKKKHSVIHNSLGFRQHREFSKNKPENVIRIGFFGDSFAENLAMESQFSFTEPLDYLLNKTGGKYEVMNFGTNGYGTDQIYLQYLQEGVGLGLDFVFYIYCSNDLRNINENDLLKLDQHGNIQARQYSNNRFISLISKLCITYFVLDHSERLRNSLKIYQEKEQNNQQKEQKKRFRNPRYVAIQMDFINGVVTDDLNKTLKLFLAILSEMKKICNEHNTRFYVITLPKEKENSMCEFLVKNGFNAIGLYDKFKNIYPEEKNYRFINDGHWNEEGNKLAAAFLFRFLAKELSIRYSGEEFIEQSLFEYYSSFEPGVVNSYLIKKHNDFPPALNHYVVSRYLSLEKRDFN